MKQTVTPGKVGGQLTVPASKSHTIRALLIAAFAQGESRIRRPLLSGDALSCLEACRSLGARIRRERNPHGPWEDWIITGTGGTIAASEEPIDVGNSGTTLFLAASLAALGDCPVSFTGDAQIRSRSIGPLLKSLEEMGVRVDRKNGEAAPFTLQGPLRGGETELPCPTSQYLSGLLLAAPLASGKTTINIPLLYERPYVEMTLQWLESQSVSLENRDFRQFIIPGGQSYRGFDEEVPGDFSSATFLFCAAALTGGRVTLGGLDPKDPQGDKEVLTMLEKMGCEVVWENSGVTLRGPTPGKAGGPGLAAVELDLNDVPDALPALAVTACYAAGTTRLVNVPQARLKETDRIAVMAEELGRLGADIEQMEDGLIITGGSLGGGEARGRGDHRVVMALALAALGAESPIIIDTAEAAAITFPEFFPLLERLKKGPALPEASDNPREPR